MKKLIENAAIYLLCMIIISFSLFPITLAVLGSFMPETEHRSEATKPLWFKKGPTLAYYNFLFTGIWPTNPYERWTERALYTANIRYFPKVMLNSILVASGVMILTLICGTTGGYIFARIKFRGSMVLFLSILASRLLPPVALALPYYIVCSILGITSTLFSVILIHSAIALPFVIWYLTLYYRTIPTEIEEASLIDGCTIFQTFYKISLRIAASGIAAIGLFSFLLSYNELLFAQFLLEKIDVQTIPVFLAGLTHEPDISWAMVYTLLTLIFIPSLILIIVIWKYLRLSELIGALKY
ncbi:MAG: carbohydrate ABC transporter permease [Candidatus Methanomethylicia archaeon]